MRALVTGGAGFIGSHLVDALLERGDSVTVLDNLSTGRAENLTQHIGNPRLRFVLGSITDPALVASLVPEADAVFHLAAAVGNKLILDRPLESLVTNIRGSEIVLEAVLEHGKRILVASSSEIYGKCLQVPLHEDTDCLLGPPVVTRWSYATAKAVDEFLAYTYWRTRGLPAVIVRLFNTTGPRQSADYGMVLPRFVHQALEGRDLTVHGDGSQTRCFAYVGDVVRALIALMECGAAEGRVVNIGSTEEVTIAALARLILDLTASSSNIRFVPYEVAYPAGFEDVPRRVPNIDAARELIGFEPRVSLREIVTLTIADALAEGRGREAAGASSRAAP
jgi:UDP-glucose 4-epimerase